MIALAGCRTSTGEWTVLGLGRSAASGRQHGEIVKLSDVVESVTEALRMAEKISGLRCRKLYFNFDDAQMVAAQPVGSKSLSGEGQIRREDVREAARSASRMADDFNLSPVYARETGYLIDGKDPVGDPVGVYGHRLDVTLHVLLARATVAEQWKNVMRRSQVERFVPVLSLDSVCRSVLERLHKRCIVWDLGDDFTSGGVADNGVLRAYQVFLTSEAGPEGLAARIEEISRGWMKDHEVTEPLVLSGDRASAVSLTLGSTVASARSVAGLDSPSNTALVGLLEGASQRERRIAALRSSGQWARHAREKANAFIQEYF